MFLADTGTAPKVDINSLNALRPSVAPDAPLLAAVLPERPPPSTPRSASRPLPAGRLGGLGGLGVTELGAMSTGMGPVGGGGRLLLSGTAQVATSGQNCLTAATAELHLSPRLCRGAPFRASPKMRLGSQAGTSSPLPPAPLLLVPSLPPPLLLPASPLPLPLKAWAKMTGWARPRSSTPCSRRNCSLSTARSRARVEWLPTSSSGRPSGIWLRPRLREGGGVVGSGKWVGWPSG